MAAALASYDFEPTAQQLAAAQRWSKLIRDGLIERVKETALEADFRRYIIEDVLGYRSVGSGSEFSVATKEPLGNGEVDLALGKFSAAERKVLAPFELKGPAFKNLDAIMPGRAKTPVQQAWEYGIDAVGGRWVLVSNQVEVRLYAIGRGRRDYEFFDLSKLDDPPLLKRFHLLLAESNLLGSLTTSLLQRSLQEDKEITVSLYRDYNSLRTTLIDVINAERPSRLLKNSGFQRCFGFCGRSTAAMSWKRRSGRRCLAMSRIRTRVLGARARVTARARQAIWASG